MRYFKSRKNAAYEDLLKGSVFLQQVSRPYGVNTTDVTTSRFSIIKHPTLDEFALAVSEDYIPVHPGVASLLESSGNFPEQEAFINNQAESARIRNSMLGKNKIIAKDLIPQRWTERTEEEMNTEGWFNDVGII